MTKTAYLQCPTGIAGDMCLGALVDAGVPLEYLTEKLELLGISDEYQLKAEAVDRNGQLATKIHVDLTQTPAPHHHEQTVTQSPIIDQSKPHHHPPNHTRVRHLPDIEQMIRAAGLPKQAESWSLAVFYQLALAEGAVHGIAPEKVHFHEVGATDAIVDIVGTCLGLDWLKIEQLYCSALPTGGGTVWAAHGKLPVPAPAVLKLLEMGKVPIYSNGIEKELVTPTGAAIAVTLATAFGEAPAMSIHKVGLGAGSRDLALPNILRLWIGESDTRKEGENFWSQIRPKPATTATEEIVVLETQIDDLSPQGVAYTLEQLFAVGAVDVFTQPVTMKKSRLGVLLTVICHPHHQAACETVLFRETTTLGIRSSRQNRRILNREMQQVKTPYGAVKMKVAFSENAVINVHPEYEDCAQLARQNQVSWLSVHRSALQAWSNLKEAGDYPL